MATLDWPAGPAWCPTRLAFGAVTPRSAWAGFFTGQQQSISHAGTRLRVDMTLPPCDYAAAAMREAYLLQLASTGDWVRLRHMQRPVPAGTLRGAPTIVSAAAAGATSIVVQGAGTTVNLLSEAQAFDAPTWIADATVTPNVAEVPNGASVRADQITDSSPTVYQEVYQDVTVPDDTQAYTVSVYVAATSGGTSKTFSMETTFSGGTSTGFSLRVNTDTGAILSGTGVVTSLDSGTWWRISFVHSNNGSGNTTLRYVLYPARCAHNSATPDPTQTGSAIVWGPQVERGTTLTALSQPTLAGGDMLGVSSQLLMVGYAGALQTSGASMTIPLATPLHTALAGGEAVTWFQPTGNFQLLTDLQQLEYLPGRYQGPVNLSFGEVY